MDETYGNKCHKTNEMVYKICQAFNEPVRCEIYLDFLMADFNHILSSCLHAKVGSTTWSNHFNAISPNDTKNELEHKFGKRLFKQEIIRPHYRLPNDVMIQKLFSQIICEKCRRYFFLFPGLLSLSFKFLLYSLCVHEYCMLPSQ